MYEIKYLLLKHQSNPLAFLFLNIDLQSENKRKSWNN